MSLNPQRGNMYPWVDATWNPLGGWCYHECGYCIPAGTLIIMADFMLKSIEKIQVGDSVLGLKEKDKGYSRYVKSKVLKTMPLRKARTLLIKTNDNTIECTPEHKLLGGTSKRNVRDWREAKIFSPYDRIRFLGIPTQHPKSYYRGWLSGYCDGDGCFYHTSDKRIKKPKKYLGFQTVNVEKSVYNEFIRLCNMFEIKTKEGIKHTTSKSFSNGKKYPMISTRGRFESENLRNLISFDETDEDFLRGYIGGMIDAEGCVGSKMAYVRIAQKPGIELERIEKALTKLNLPYVIENYVGHCSGVRIIGGIKTKLRLLFECHPKHSKKAERLLYGHSIKDTPISEVISVEQGGIKNVYNIETETGNYIANGFIVHNCLVKANERFKRLHKYNVKPFISEKELRENLYKCEDKKPPFTIFVGNMTDIFAKDIPLGWIQRILLCCNHFPNNTYLFQSKNPGRFRDLIEMLPPRVILGTTIESNWDYGLSKAPTPNDRAAELGILNLRKMVSIEPIMDFDMDMMLLYIRTVKPEFVSIGADSQDCGLNEPTKEKITDLITELEKFTKVYQKENLKRLMI